MKKIITVLLSILMIIGGAAAVYAAVPADGTYSVSVSKNGGTGRVEVVSPCTVTVHGGNITARVVWTSTNYTWMRVAGVTYYNENSGGNSTFTIPVTAFDTPIAVSAETTAMSEPHVIDYTLTFSSSGVSMKDESSQSTQSQEHSSSSNSGKADKNSDKNDKKDNDSEKNDKIIVDSGKNIVINNKISRSTSVNAQMLSESKGKTMKLITSNGSILFDKKALEYITKKASGGITLTMNDVTGDKAYNGKYDLVVDISLKDDKSQMLFSEDSAGKANITLNFENPEKNTTNINVYRITENGAEKIDSEYDAESGTVTFDSDKLSVYAISADSAIGSGIYIVAGILVLAAVLGIIILKKRKKNVK